MRCADCAATGCDRSQLLPNNMSITLHALRPASGAHRPKKRIGRGLGSKGTTAGRGQKGQSSRSGVGGLQRLGMRHVMLATPKLRGFRSLAPKLPTVTLAAIAKMYRAGEVVSPRTLGRKGLILDTGAKAAKILCVGEIAVAVNVKHCRVSAAAAEKIIAAGGSVA